MGITGWIRRHALVTYFVLAFAISWAAVLAVILPATGLIASDVVAPSGGLFAAVFVAMLLGPVIGSLALTAITGGAPAFRALGERMSRSRVPGRYYAAIAVAPVSLFVVLWAISLYDPAFRPGILTASSSTIIAGIGFALAAGFFEEIGWTGFATPRLIARYGVTRGAIVLGVLWSLWHVLVTYWGSAASYGSLYLFSFVQGLVYLTAFRVVMTAIYERTGSVFLSQFLHASLTASVILLAPKTTNEEGLVWNTLFAVVLVLAAVVATVGVRLPAAARKLRPA